MPYEYARLYMNDAVWVDYPLRTNSPSRGDSSWLGDPLANLASLPAGRNRRISSNELPAWHDANLDMTILPPGKTVEMPVLDNAPPCPSTAGGTLRACTSKLGGFQNFVESLMAKAQ